MKPAAGRLGGGRTSASLGLASAGLVSLALAGCDPTGTGIPPEDIVAAGVWTVVTVDPADPSRTELLATAWLHWTRTGRRSNEVPGASVRVVGESGRSVELVQMPEQESCFTPGPIPPDIHHIPTYGTCYLASASPSPLAPGERISLTIESPAGGVAEGATRLPEAFVPAAGLASEGGRCLVEPDRNHRFSWGVAEGAQAYVGGAAVKGLDPRIWPGEDTLYAGEPLYMTGLPFGRDSTEMVFPRDFGTLFSKANVAAAVTDMLQVGLPEGAAADVAVGAIDRNWFNWIRLATFETLFVNTTFDTGEIRIPSIFGAGTGVFGAGVRWTVAVESRPRTGDGDPPQCGPVVED